MPILNIVLNSASQIFSTNDYKTTHSQFPQTDETVLFLQYFWLYYTKI